MLRSRIRRRAIPRRIPRLPGSSAALWQLGGCCLVFCLVRPITAAEERSITVTGNGEVKARPNRLEIELLAGGAAELTDDAMIKYDESLRRVSEAFDRLKIDRLSIEQGDLSFASTVPVNGRAPVTVARNAGAKPHLAITQSLRLTLSGIDRLSQKELVATVGKLVDTAQDAGATIGNNPGGNLNPMIDRYGRAIIQNQAAVPLVAFFLEDYESLHDQAYRKAFEEATARAEKLAKHAHGTLGEVISIDDASQAFMRPDGSVQQLLAAVRLSEIPVTVSLRVRFELRAEKRE
ncbi:MAG TPA: SIMPL domain-containing protein [Pirellulales bacterium]|nr:SIMPL domain-containing protein [Pirellulales bacterium]